MYIYTLFFFSYVVSTKFFFTNMSLFLQLALTNYRYLYL